MGPLSSVRSYSAYFINGYNFHTSEHGQGRATMNNGVCTRCTSYTDVSTDFYGKLEEILELTFHGAAALKVVLFRCDWVDPIKGMRVNNKYHSAEVNFRFLYKKNEPFILAQQAEQVYFADFPSLNQSRRGWLAVCKTRARRTIEGRWTEETDEPFQLAHPNRPIETSTLDADMPLADPSHILVELDPEEQQRGRRPRGDNVEDDHEESSADDNETTDDEEYVDEDGD